MKATPAAAACRDYLVGGRQTGLTGRVAEAVLEDSQRDDDVADDHREAAETRTATRRFAS